MIGADTNVLVRIFIADDLDQSAAAKRLLARCDSDTPLYFNIIVVVELVWAWKNVYKLSDAEVRAALLALCDSNNVHVEQRDVVQQAVALNEANGAGLADLLIAGLNRAKGALTMTFDQMAAKRIEGMELLS